ncbi:flagellar biosynthesis anti-sigma factor FlgM [Cytobacillus firmus]|uniref:flagellar biosynthesis anti-sigma factor FlgM n=1 Tax=Cytobacillus firmus TaxID=1399 RepID=UPI00218BAC8E|nr:flagellar biosynthesis anti-sigma factor FlgM [Cytobacillus firmus]URM33449.1 flagellar biosynthesis anti-sigma factor FlgM [Cytobacillus firmus]
MKINNYGRVGMNPYNKQLEKTEKAQQAGKKDKIEISSEAQELLKGDSIEAKRQQTVDDLKAKVQSGEYKIEPKKIAEKMYSFWNDKY